MSSQVEIAKAYLAAIEQAVPVEQLAVFFCEDVEQVEFPNQLTVNGAIRNLEQVLDGHERGKEVVANQRYQIDNIIESGSSVVLEVRWTAELLIKLPMLDQGKTMGAHFAVVLEFRDGKIAKQRNYDCFDPW